VLQELWTTPLVMSHLLLAKFAGVLVYFKIIGLLMVIILRGLSL
jgi:hypothetical protein